MSSSACIFCDILKGNLRTSIVFEDDSTLAFLDHRPLFPGHTLVIPREHIETLGDMPLPRIPEFFRNVQLLAQAVEIGMGAEGTFVAMNNRVSQSVPHLHVHVVPRRKKDGLKGFFWPRTKYSDEQQLNDVSERLRSVISDLKKTRTS